MTEYIAATNSAEYKQCKQFLAAELGRTPKLSFPTIMAKRDGEIVGLLGTSPSDKAIICGPAVNPKRNGLLLVNMLDAYERVLEMAGVSSYLFCIAADDVDYVDQVCRALKITPFDFKDGIYWFKREI